MQRLPVASRHSKSTQSCWSSICSKTICKLYNVFYNTFILSIVDFQSCSTFVPGSQSFNSGPYEGSCSPQALSNTSIFVSKTISRDCYLHIVFSRPLFPNFFLVGLMQFAYCLVRLWVNPALILHIHVQDQTSRTSKQFFQSFHRCITDIFYCLAFFMKPG